MSGDLEASAVTEIVHVTEGDTDTLPVTDGVGVTVTVDDCVGVTDTDSSEDDDDEYDIVGDADGDMVQSAYCVMFPVR
jgi:hypothetical protein